MRERSKRKNYINGGVENLELADMQGIQGLKALRISVNNDFVVDKTSDEKIFEQPVTAAEKFLGSMKN